jgi:hypothetical protein
MYLAELQERTEQFWELWKLYNIRGWSLDGIYLGAAVRQSAKAIGLMLVVVFGSCSKSGVTQQSC